MGYAVYLAIAEERDVIAFREKRIASMTPLRIVDGSHAISSFIEVEGLRMAVQEAYDGGTVLREDLYHPYHPPIYHTSVAVKDVSRRLSEKYKEFLRTIPDSEAEFWDADLIPTIELLEEASRLDKPVVVTLGYPFDEERASKVIQPFKIPREQYS